MLPLPLTLTLATPGETDSDHRRWCCLTEWGVLLFQAADVEPREEAPGVFESSKNWLEAARWRLENTASDVGRRVPITLETVVICMTISMGVGEEKTLKSFFK